MIKEEESQRDIAYIKEQLSNNLSDTNDTLKALLELKEHTRNTNLDIVIIRVREAEFHLQLANSHMRELKGGE